MNRMNKKMMILLVAIASNVIIAQKAATFPDSFIFISNNSPEKAGFFKTSIQAADMEQYRLRDQRVRLEFENGFEIELLSAKELFVNGTQLNINNYPASHGKGQLPVFSVLNNGHLTAKVFNQPAK